jgi:asparagine N-glycosylation enzyme membrane subunit Stt3
VHPSCQTLGVTKTSMSKATWILFAVAGGCYLLAWTGAAIGLGILGFVVELMMYVSMYFDGKRKPYE